MSKYLVCTTPEMVIFIPEKEITRLMYNRKKRMLTVDYGDKVNCSTGSEKPLWITKDEIARYLTD